MKYKPKSEAVLLCKMSVSVSGGSGEQIDANVFRAQSLTALQLCAPDVPWHWGQAEVGEYIGVYGRALVHEPREQAVF